MKPPTSAPSREEVLDAFAVERNRDCETLRCYLRSYPDYAEDLADLAREIDRDPCDDGEPLSAEDRSLIDAAWRRHVEAAPKVAVDPFAALATSALREVARRLNVPRQVVTAFRERRIVLVTVPHRFLARLAEALDTSLDVVEAFCAGPPTPALARSYKADGKPVAGGQVSFERVLSDAGLSAEKRAELMADAD